MFFVSQCNLYHAPLFGLNQTWRMVWSVNLFLTFEFRTDRLSNFGVDIYCSGIEKTCGSYNSLLLRHTRDKL